MKMLESGTKDEIRISKEALFKGVSTRFGRRIVENSVEKTAFHLLFLLPKSSFGEHKISSSSFVPYFKIFVWGA
jgi:hypothetical protein